MGKSQTTTLLYSDVSSGSHHKCNALISSSKWYLPNRISFNTEYPNMSLIILEILKNLAFVSARFGYSAFDEWNFVYLSSIDLLSSNTPQATTFIEKQIPGTLCDLLNSQ